MCMQNLDVAEGLCNGTVMVVERLGEQIVWCRAETRYGPRLFAIPPVR